MIKIYCNKCGKQVTKFRQIHKSINNARYNLCSDCADKWDIFHTHTANVDIEDFMKMSDEEIELALYTFKVGDHVITDDGRVGTITDICTCDRCKERGFYEPEVAFDNGEVNYIMVSAKNNGFKSYYKIGDHIFGNLNEEYLLSRMATLKEEMQELELQLNVVKTLKDN